MNKEKRCNYCKHYNRKSSFNAICEIDKTQIINLAKAEFCKNYKEW